MSTKFEVNNIIANSGDFISSLQVNSVDVSLSGHAHTSSDITDFNSSVSGLLLVKDIVSGTNTSITSSSGIYTINSISAGVSITDYGINRVLVSDGTSMGIIAQSGLTFNGSVLTAASGSFTDSVSVGSSTLTTINTLNIINSSNLYLWANFR
jgi:hypothetical protein